MIRNSGFLLVQKIFMILSSDERTSLAIVKKLQDSMSKIGLCQHFWQLLSGPIFPSTTANLQHNTSDYGSENSVQILH